MPIRLVSPPPGRTLSIELDGQTVPAIEGEPAACSLLAADETLFSRSVKYHRARGPYCFSGDCSHCLMRVDGVPNIPTCQVPAREGLRLERQNAYPSAKLDMFAAIDFFFPKGLDHHEMFAGVPVAEQVMAKVARQLAGLGTLPEKTPPERLPAERLRVPVAIVGGGAAGLGAAQVLADSGIPLQVIERERVLGGRLVAGPREENLPSPPTLPPELVRTGATAVGLYDDEDGKFLAVVIRDPSPRLLKLYADRFLIALGGHPQFLPFGNNDFPGVYAARAAVKLLRVHKVAVGEKPVIVGWGQELYATAAEFAAHGIKVEAIVDMKGPLQETGATRVLQGKPVGARGRTGVNSLTVEVGGNRQTLSCDAVVCALPLSPGFELAEQGGAFTRFDASAGVFVVDADAEGRTRAPDVWVAGEVRGPQSARGAYAQGARVGAALIEDLRALALKAVQEIAEAKR